MNYLEVFNSMSSAVHVYENVSEEERNLITQDSWSVKVANVVFIGTLNPVPELVAKEIARPAAEPVDPSIAITKLQAARDARWEQLKQGRLYRTTECGVAVAGKWFQTDVLTRSQFLRLDMQASKLLAAGSPSDTILSTASGPVAWKTMDNSFVVLTIQLIQDILVAMENQEALVFKVAEINRAQIYQSENPADYESTGWPPIYPGIPQPVE